jgi:tetratricopeptide (TPR) repeat protein
MRKDESVFRQRGEASFHQDRMKRSKKRRKPVTRHIGKMMLVILIIWFGLLAYRRMEETRLFQEIEKEKKLQFAYEQNLNDLEIKGDRFLKAEMFRESAATYRSALQILKTLVKDPEKEKSLRQKYEIVNMIVAGEKLMTAGRYEDALKKYLKTYQMPNLDNYCKLKIDARIAAIRSRIEFDNLVKTGDNELARKNFVAAIQNYQQAQTIAAHLSLSKDIKVLEQKIAVAKEEETLKNLEEVRRNLEKVQRNLEEVQKMEQTADREYEAGNYHEAAKAYQQAALAYEKLGFPREKKLAAEKAKNAERRSKSFWRRIFKPN